MRPGSPACNRVTPFGDIEAFALRGAYTGNRGILHSGREVVRFHQHDSWVTCALAFNDRWSEQWLAHHFTWLYFYDEAVSFAAGHRPCAPHVIVGSEAVEWTREGYRTRRPRPSGTVTVITPPATLGVLRAGYPVQIDPAALGARRPRPR
jgi:hypothetical protein